MRRAEGGGTDTQTSGGNGGSGGDGDRESGEKKPAGERGGAAHTGQPTAGDQRLQTNVFFQWQSRRAGGQQTGSAHESNKAAAAKPTRRK